MKRQTTKKGAPKSRAQAICAWSSVGMSCLKRRYRTGLNVSQSISKRSLTWREEMSTKRAKMYVGLIENNSLFVLPQIPQTFHVIADLYHIWDVADSGFSWNV
jgi:hypothetical protein